MPHIQTTAGKSAYRWNWNEFKYLVHVLRYAKDFPDVLNIFIDLHTSKEVAEIIRRVLIASLLIDGMTFDEIVEETGASRNTIAKVNQKMDRKNAVLMKIVQKAGNYSKFLKQSVDERDALSRLIDNSIAKRDLFGILSRKK